MPSSRESQLPRIRRIGAGSCCTKVQDACGGWRDTPEDRAHSAEYGHSAGYTRLDHSGRTTVKLPCLLAAFALLGASAMSHATTPVLVIHGGAGVIKRDMNPAREKAVRAALAPA